jgi:hypothetical protein
VKRTTEFSKYLGVNKSRGALSRGIDENFSERRFQWEHHGSFSVSALDILDIVKSLGLLYKHVLPLWLPPKPVSHSDRPYMFISFPLLGGDALCVDLSLALVYRNLVCRRTGYLLLQLLFDC